MCVFWPVLDGYRPGFRRFLSSQPSGSFALGHDRSSDSSQLQDTPGVGSDMSQWVPYFSAWACAQKPRLSRTPHSSFNVVFVCLVSSEITSKETKPEPRFDLSWGVLVVSAKNQWMKNGSYARNWLFKVHRSLVMCWWLCLFCYCCFCCVQCSRMRAELTDMRDTFQVMMATQVQSYRFMQGLCGAR